MHSVLSTLAQSEQCYYIDSIVFSLIVFVLTLEACKIKVNVTIMLNTKYMVYKMLQVQNTSAFFQDAAITVILTSINACGTRRLFIQVLGPEE